MTAVWLLLGLLAGAVNWTTQRRAVATLTLQAGSSPETSGRAQRRILTGTLLRLTLSALVLAGAVMNGLFSGLAAFAGLWLARWIGILSLKRLPLVEDEGE